MYKIFISQMSSISSNHKQYYGNVIGQPILTYTTKVDIEKILQYYENEEVYPKKSFQIYENYTLWLSYHTATPCSIRRHKYCIV